MLISRKVKYSLWKQWKNLHKVFDGLILYLNHLIYFYGLFYKLMKEKSRWLVISVFTEFQPQLQPLYHITVLYFIFTIFKKKMYDNIHWFIRKRIFSSFTRLKNKIENNSTWEGAFYQSEWVKINWSWVNLLFSLYVCCW